jgi:hypothetical protein
MDVRPRHIALFTVLAVVGVGLLSSLIEAAGQDVALAVAIAAIALLVASYVWAVLTAVRSPGPEHASEVLQRRARVLIPVQIATPLVVLAAHPWGIATLPVAFGVLFVCHLLFIHALLVAGFILQRRARQAPPQ